MFQALKIHLVFLHLLLYCGEVSLTPGNVETVNLRCHALLNNADCSTVTKPLQSNHGNYVPLRVFATLQHLH